MHSEINVHIKEAADEVVDMLLRKNLAYGDSALNPLRVFSKADAGAGLRVRIDDKLSRIRNTTKKTRSVKGRNKKSTAKRTRGIEICISKSTAKKTRSV